MKTLFTMDLKNYKEDWPRSRRDSARAIIRVGDDKLALVYATKLGYYKFPGGGIKPDEDIRKALHPGKGERMLDKNERDAIRKCRREYLDKMREKHREERERMKHSQNENL